MKNKKKQAFFFFFLEQNSKRENCAIKFFLLRLEMLGWLCTQVTVAAAFSSYNKMKSTFYLLLQPLSPH